MATWPTTLPTPIASGYAINPVDQTIRTQMEMGAARVRRRTSARNDSLNVAWVLSDAQLGIFRAWFDGNAAGGASWFTIPLAIGTVGLVSVSARFSGGYTVAHIGGLNWKIAATLEVR